MSYVDDFYGGRCAFRLNLLLTKGKLAITYSKAIHKYLQELN